MKTFLEAVESAKLKAIKDIHVKSDRNPSNGNLKLKLIINGKEIWKNEYPNKDVNTTDKLKFTLEGFVSFGLTSNGYKVKSDEIYDIVVAIADTKLKAFFHRNKKKSIMLA